MTSFQNSSCYHFISLFASRHITQWQTKSEAAGARFRAALPPLSYSLLAG
jgi:hypothetical protein